jgi:tetratricopeptide (TPR) repeat protein
MPWLVVVVMLALSSLAGLWWFCYRNPSARYLPEEGPARWIVYPTPRSGDIHPIGERTTVFRNSFDIENVPDRAPLCVRCFVHFQVSINGTAVASSETSVVGDWKSLTEMDAAPYLHSGRNDVAVRVTNATGPPALWFQMSIGNRMVVSDSAWETSLLGSVPRPARCAADVAEGQPGNSLYEAERPMPSLFSQRVPLLWFAGLAAAFAGGIGLALRRWPVRPGPRLSWPLLFAAAVTVAWIILFANNWPSLPVAIGFDASQHLDYIRFVRQRWSVPLASDGWEMHQPPLYYLISAGSLALCGLQADEGAGLLLLRFEALLMGLAQVFLIAACLRVVFPGRPVRRGVGLALAAFLPMHLYTTHYLANDLLAGVFALGAVYLTLVLLRGDPPSPGRLAALGGCLGAAILTKLTAAAAAVAVFAVLTGWLAARAQPLRLWLRMLGVPLLACLAVCGWFFLRNFQHFGTPLIGSYDSATGFRWWQEPGYAMAAQGLRFGRSLVAPFHGVLDGIPDGIYSLLWGDGSWGSAGSRLYRPPWNYELMAAGYLLALVPCLLAVVGIVAALAEIVRRPNAVGFLMLALPASFSVAMLYHYLKYPYFCHVKAFYALPAVLSLCAFAGWGFDLLAWRSGVARVVLGTFLGLWALTAYASFWVDGSAANTHAWAAGRFLARENPRAAQAHLEAALQLDPENFLARHILAKTLLAANRFPEAATELGHILRADPQDANAHFLLAKALAGMGQSAEALEHAETAVQFGPDHEQAYQLLTVLRLARGDTGGVIIAAREALRIAPTDAELHEMLAGALAKSNALAEAVDHYQIALRFQPDSLAAQEALARILATQRSSSPVGEPNASSHLKAPPKGARGARSPFPQEPER